MIDSMIYGEINSVEQPYRLTAIGLNKAHKDAVNELSRVFAALALHKNHTDIAADKALLEVV